MNTCLRCVIKCNTLLKSSILPTPAITAATQLQYQQVRGKARPATRIRKAKEAKKNRARKLARQEADKYKPHTQKGPLKITPPFKYEDLELDESPDDVYIMSEWRVQKYQFSSALSMLREANHPTMLDAPDAIVKTTVHLDLTTNRPTRFVDKWKDVVQMPHPFETGSEMSVLAICRDVDVQKEAEDAGATDTGGVETVKLIESGVLKVKDYDYVVCHPDIIEELIPVRGLLKNKFPSTKAGTCGSDVVSMVSRFARGLTYATVKNDNYPHYGWVEAPIGTLDMPDEHIMANYNTFFSNIKRKGRNPKSVKSSDIVSQLLVSAEPCKEIILVDHKHAELELNKSQSS